MKPGELCPSCGTVTPTNALGGLCPRCLLGGVLDPLVLAADSEASAAEDSSVSLDQSNPIAAGRRFGNYTLLADIGRGGNGIVWQARQVKPDRIVALKMLLFGGSAGQAEVLRFK